MASTSASPTVTSAPSPTTLQKILAAAVGAVPGLISRASAPDLNSNVPPELRQLLQQSVNRQEYQNPLFQATTQQAFMGLPTYARQGLSLNPSGPAPTSAPSGSSGGFSLPAAVTGGALASLLTPALSGGGGDLPIAKIAKLFAKLFHHGGPTVQGDKPLPGGTDLPIGNPGMPDFTGFDPGAPDPFLTSDPGVFYGPTGGGATVTDPSGGTGLGPGMQLFYQDDPYGSGGY